MNLVWTVLILMALVCAPVQLQAQARLFAAPGGAPITVGLGSGEILLVDLNQDGHLDLVTKHLLDRRISVRFGGGTDPFSTAAEMRFDFEPGAISIADVNDDAILDLGIASREGEREYVHILLGGGDASFTEAAGSPFDVSSSFDFYKPDLYLLDINEDSKNDVVAANGRRNSIEVLFGDGRGGFSRGPTVALEADGDLYSMMPGDVDGDGHPDLVIAMSLAGGSGQVAIMLGDGKGDFVKAQNSSLEVLAAPRVAALTDANGDNHLDAIITHGRIATLEVLLNRGDGTFSSPSQHAIADWANAVLVTDVNRDGAKDLIAATVDSVTVLLGYGGGFTPAPGSPFPAGPGAYNAAAGDLNEDGRMDLVASSFEGSTVTVLMGQ